MPKASTTRKILTRYDFEDGSSVEIAVTGPIDTPTAVKVAGQLLKLKEDEIGVLSGGKRPTIAALKAAAE